MPSGPLSHTGLTTEEQIQFQVNFLRDAATIQLRSNSSETVITSPDSRNYRKRSKRIPELTSQFIYDTYFFTKSNTNVHHE
ncbi:hypothetical protein VP01_475g4 [Puccinia sorghi]|uniref:Uncharacterized protein n=1 Tax=Puccinia sorghi TaxID=27349 RepID=A0A0L6UMT0_9BASI|nr:hypothetical protein VP01_475g4 [Puccinia sorghi]